MFWESRAVIEDVVLVFVVAIYLAEDMAKGIDLA